MSLGLGGAEILLVQYIKSLGMKDYDHFVYCFGSNGPVREKIEALGIKVYMGKRRALIKQPIRFIAQLLSLLQDLMKFIKSNRIQLIQSHLSHANKLAVLVGKLAGVPAFPTIHNTMEFVDRRSRWDFRVYINKAVDWFIFPMADQILAVSQEIKEIVHQRFRVNNSKIMVLKNGIVFDNRFSVSVDLEKEFLISENTLKIIAVGRLSYQKALEVLVQAASELVNQGMHNIFVMIAGEGEDRVRLETLVSDLGLANYVKLLGIRHDVIGLMKASDIFVMPSRYEGLSIAMIEAMACGLPIIASDAPGLRTFIKHGQNGLLFPIEDHDLTRINSVRSGVINNGSWINYWMNKEGHLYSASISGQDLGIFVEYRVQANDTVGNWGISSVEAYTVIDCVNPTISLLTELTDTGQNEVVEIQVEVDDSGGVKQVLLCYSLDSGITFTNTSMGNVSGVWTASIPLGIVGESVYFSIYAEDQAGNWENSQLYTYLIIDVLSPNVIITITPLSSNQTEALKVEVEISDDSEILNVQMRYSVDNWANESELSLELQDGVWAIQIEIIGTAVTIQYQIVVEDSAHNIYESGIMFYTLVQSPYQGGALDLNSALVAITSGGIGVASVLIILFLRRRQDS